VGALSEGAIFASLCQTSSPVGTASSRGQALCRDPYGMRSAMSAPNLVAIGEGKSDGAPRILIVQAEEALARPLVSYLAAQGYLVEHVDNGDEADLHIVGSSPDLVILDWMLPGISGIEICRRMRARDAARDMPIIMLAARDEESERVRGVSVGADDYLAKPFSLPELLTRVRALLERVRPEHVPLKLSFGDIDLDRDTRRVRRSGRTLSLRPTEFRLLECLMQSPGRVFTRAQLLDSVWGISAKIEERTVDVHIGRLRRALLRSRDKNPIRTVHGVGYSFDKGFETD
jgi:two-component system phosphate regulon response regulator PhoB